MVESAALPVSAPMAESFRLPDTARHALPPSAEFSAPPNAAEKRGISVGILIVAIVVPLLVVAAGIVAFIVLRYCRGDDIPELLPDRVSDVSDLYKSGAYVTTLNPDAQGMEADELFFESE
jgi:hypothetical protein